MTKREAEKVQAGALVQSKGRRSLGALVVCDKGSFGDPVWFAVRAANGEVLCRSHWDLTPIKTATHQKP